MDREMSFTAPASLRTHSSMVGMFMRVVIHPQQDRIERFDNFLLDGSLNRAGDTGRRSTP